MTAGQVSPEGRRSKPTNQAYSNKGMNEQDSGCTGDDPIPPSRDHRSHPKYDDTYSGH